MTTTLIKLAVWHKGYFHINQRSRRTEYINGKKTVLHNELDTKMLTVDIIKDYLEDVGYTANKRIFYKCKLTNEYILMFNSNLEMVQKLLVPDEEFEVFIDEGVIESRQDEIVLDETDDIINDYDTQVDCDDVEHHDEDDEAIECGIETQLPNTNLTDDDEEELQLARAKVREWKKSSSQPGTHTKEGDNQEQDSRNEEQNQDVEDDELPDSDSDESWKSSDYFSSDEEGSYYSETDNDVSDDAMRRHSNVIRFDPTAKIPVFCLGMVFENVQQVRDAVAKYAIVKGLGVHYVKNDKVRVRVECGGGCPWKLLVSYESRHDHTMTVKTYNPHHQCKRISKSKFATSDWVKQQYKSTVQRNPRIKIRELKQQFREDWALGVSMSICLNAKHKILEELQGDFKKQFCLLYAYQKEIFKSNPGSSCEVKVNSEYLDGIPRFQAFYVCFDACKRGWKDGCRPIIGLDGCFLKGICKGQLLSAVGRDGNNQMFPIAWAVVNVENKENWSWFLTWIKRDLQLEDGCGVTLISDMQKGLEASIPEVLPEAEHRMCARHVYAAWAKKWRGEERKKAFWACAKATNMPELKDRLNDLKELGEQCLQDALEMSGHTIDQWSKAFFTTRCQCDVVDNNLAETFNGWILEARCKPIVTMVDEIRVATMKRIAAKLELPKTWICDISERALKKLEKNIKLSYNWIVDFNGDNDYEVTMIRKPTLRHVVNLKERKCSCREWDISGIPCPHAITAIYDAKYEPLDFVAHWYHKETYLKAYQYKIKGIVGMDMWEVVENSVILPPAFRKMPGRPKKCRRKDKDEVKKTVNLSKSGRVTTCTICKEKNHNAKTCKKRIEPVVLTKSNEKRRRIREEKRVSEAVKDRKTTQNKDVVNALKKSYRKKGSRNTQNGS